MTTAREDQSRRGTEIEPVDDPNRKRGMVLPFEPLSLTFDNVKYSVDMPVVSLSFEHMYMHLDAKVQLSLLMDTSEERKN